MHGFLQLLLPFALAYWISANLGGSALEADQAHQGTPGVQNPQPDCTTTPKTIQHQYKLGTDTTRHWTRTVTLPATGKFVQEAHYVTNQDTFPDGRAFANTTDENINRHLQRSAEIYHRFDTAITIAQLYTNTYETHWTPAERGQIGQGCVGNVQTTELSPEMELWMLNMMWAPGHKPTRGTKFLLSANNKKLVVVAGYETGPAGEQFLGGITTEAHRYLGTDETSEITVGYLSDQTVALGPMDCEF